MIFGGVRVIENVYCTQAEWVLQLPALPKTAKKRVRQKYLKRARWIEVQKPAAFIVGGNTIMAHPAVVAQLMQQVRLA